MDREQLARRLEQICRDGGGACLEELADYAGFPDTRMGARNLEDLFEQIKDADLIYPWQTFEVDRNPAASDVEAAVDHARNRGAWSIGVMEESDRRFLGGSLRLH